VGDDSVVWLVSHISGYPDGQPLFDGATNLEDTPPLLAQDLYLAPAAYARFFQTLDSTGTSSQPLPSGFTNNTALASTISDAKRNWTALTAGGLVPTYTHIVNGVSPEFGWTFASKGCGSFLCFSLQEYSTVTATRGTSIIQSQRRNQWGLCCLLGCMRACESIPSSTSV
jgi:hypothetical protein